MLLRENHKAMKAFEGRGFHFFEGLTSMARMGGDEICSQRGHELKTNDRENREHDVHHICEACFVATSHDGPELMDNRSLIRDSISIDVLRSHRSGDMELLLPSDWLWEGAVRESLLDFSQQRPHASRLIILLFG